MANRNRRLREKGRRGSRNPLFPVSPEKLLVVSSDPAEKAPDGDVDSAWMSERQHQVSEKETARFDSLVSQYSNDHPEDSIIVLATLTGGGEKGFLIGSCSGYSIDEALMCCEHVREILHKRDLYPEERMFIAENLIQLANEARASLPGWGPRTQRRR